MIKSVYAQTYVASFEMTFINIDYISLKQIVS